MESSHTHPPCTLAFFLLLWSFCVVQNRGCCELSDSTAARAVVLPISGSAACLCHWYYHPCCGLDFFVSGFRKGLRRGAVVGTAVARGSTAYISGSTAPTSIPTAAQLAALLYFPAAVGSGSTALVRVLLIPQPWLPYACLPQR